MTTPTVTPASSQWPENIAESEAARIADLDRWLGSRGDLEDSEVAAGAESVFGLLDRSAS